MFGLIVAGAGDPTAAGLVPVLIYGAAGLIVARSPDGFRRPWFSLSF